jgi:hypothetical protein
MEFRYSLGKQPLIVAFGGNESRDYVSKTIIVYNCYVAIGYLFKWRTIKFG